MSAPKPHFFGDRRYRRVCSGSRPIPPPGPCFQHYRDADAAIATHTNVTLVNPGDPIAPYPRLARHTASCAADPACDPGPHGEPTCDPWPFADRPGGANGVACHAADSTHQTVALNCFENGGGVANLALCRKMGFKNVQAVKTWHGRYGLMHLDGVTEDISSLPTGTIPGGDCPCGHPFEAERATVDGTKYRTLEITVHHQNSGSFSGFLDVNATSYRKTSVGRYSGEETLVSHSDSYSDHFGGSPGVGAVGDTQYTPPEPATLQSCIDLFYARLGEMIAWGAVQSPPISPTITGTIGEWSASMDGRTGSPATGPVYSLTLSVSGGYCHYEVDNYTDEIPCGGSEPDYAHPTTKTIENIDLTNTHSVHYTAQDDRLESECNGLDETTVTADLSDAYTAANVKSDITALLAQLNLADDRVYPWRTDNWVTVAPMARYDEPLGAVAPHPRPSQIDNDDGGLDTWTAEGYTAGVANPPAYSGDIRGAPLPAGYDKYFDFDHVTWRCCRDELGIPGWYEYTYGAFSGQTNSGDTTDAAVPGTATQWTENHGTLGADQCFPGSWMVFNGALGFMWAQKWAEIKNPRPAYNFFGPCGDDRFRYNELLVGCVDSYDAGTKTVTLKWSGVSSLTSGVGLICGIDPAVDGVWNFTRTSDTVYVLTGSRLRTAPARDDCTDPTFGKLLFPDAWPICGRVKVQSATVASGTVTVNCAPAPSLRTGDVVDFTDAAGTVTESNKTVTVLSDTQFTFSGSVPTGAYVVSHGAPKWFFYSNLHAGSYLYATWTHNFRDFQERDRVNSQYTDCGSCSAAAPADATPIRANQAAHGMPQSVAAFTVDRFCLNFTPCYPQVMASSPNGETWDNGRTHAWPETFPLDGRYGSLWNALVIQEVNDYLYQSLADPESENTYSNPTTWPHTPCDIQANNHDPEADHIFWQEDQGGCSEDDATHRYFPFRPLVEPELVLPVVNGITAPALPAGFYLGFLSLAALDTSGDVNGNILLPPEPPGADCETNAPFQFQTPWGLYLAMFGCVCADPPGRFAQPYADMFVLSCPPAS